MVIFTLPTQAVVKFKKSVLFCCEINNFENKINYVAFKWS